MKKFKYIYFIICFLILILSACQTSRAISPIKNIGDRGKLADAIISQYHYHKATYDSSYIPNNFSPLTVIFFEEDNFLLKFSSIDQNNNSEVLCDNQWYQSVNQNSVKSSRTIYTTNNSQKLISINQLCSALKFFSLNDIYQIYPNLKVDIISLYGLINEKQTVNLNLNTDCYISDNNHITKLNDSFEAKSGYLELIIKFKNSSSYIYLLVPVE